jgi:hypothetical protein
MSTGFELELAIVAHGHAAMEQGEKPLQHDRANRDELRRTARGLLAALDRLDELDA